MLCCPQFASSILEVLVSQVQPAQHSGKLVNQFISHATIGNLSQEDLERVAIACMQLAQPGQALTWVRKAVESLAAQLEPSETAPEATEGTLRDALRCLLNNVLSTLFNGKLVSDRRDHHSVSTFA